MGTASATSALTIASRVRDRPMRIASAASPASSDGEVDPPGVEDDVHRLREREVRLGLAPVRPGSWPRMMLTAIPVRKPVITECDTKRV